MLRSIYQGRYRYLTQKKGLGLDQFYAIEIKFGYVCVHRGGLSISNKSGALAGRPIVMLRGVGVA